MGQCGYPVDLLDIGVNIRLKLEVEYSSIRFPLKESPNPFNC